MQYYSFDLTTWTKVGFFVSLALLAVIYLAFIKHRRSSIILFGILLIIGSIPTAVMTQLSSVGCCGAPDPGRLRDALGLIVFVVTLCVGLISLYFGVKHNKTN